MTSNFYSFLRQNRSDASPATCLDLIVGTDADGWPIFRTFSVGDICVSESGFAYRVLGFSLNNTVFAKPHGLHGEGVSFVEFQAAGLRHEETHFMTSHRDGLVLFSE